MRNRNRIRKQLTTSLMIMLMAVVSAFAAPIGESSSEADTETGTELQNDMNKIVVDLAPVADSIRLSLDQNGSGDLFNSVTVKPDEIRNGDVVVFGGVGEVEGHVNGSVVVFGGSARVSGQVEEDVVVIGGSVNLEPTARIDGSVVVIGGVINRAEGAVVDGDVVVLGGGSGGSGLGTHIITPDFGISRTIIVSWILLTWLVLAFFVTLLFTRSVENTAEIAIERPIQSLLTGFVFHVSALLICMLLTVILIGIPLAFLGSLLWMMISVFGTTVGFMIMGRLVWNKVRKGYGSALLVFLVGFLILGAVRFVPLFIGWTIWQLWGMAGIGATVLSRFGSNKPWFGRRLPQNSVPVPPATPVEILP